MDDEIINNSIEAANKEFKEEPMNANYSNKIVGIISRGRVKKIIKELGNLSGKVVLDAGSESGYVTMQILKRCKPDMIYAIDICQEAIDYFKSKVSDKRVDIRCGMIQKLPYEDSKFDVVISTEVMEHAPYPKTILAEFKRVLKQNGKLIITVPNESARTKFYPLAKRFGVNTDVEKDVTLLSYTKEDLKKLLTNCGFKIVKTYGIPRILNLTTVVIARK